MKPVLIVYGTHEGHTRKIAIRVERVLESHSIPVEVLDSAELPSDFDSSNYDGFIIAGSVHQGNHQRALAHFVKAHLSNLVRRPSLFLSVSLTAVHHDEEHEVEVKEYIDRFLTETSWMPHEVYPVAGALKYVEYDWFKRMIMKSIVKKQGGDVDTSRDYEYTDWEALEARIADFAARSFAVANV